MKLDWHRGLLSLEGYWREAELVAYGRGQGGSRSWQFFQRRHASGGAEETLLAAFFYAPKNTSGSQEVDLHMESVLFFLVYADWLALLRFHTIYSVKLCHLLHCKYFRYHHKTRTVVFIIFFTAKTSPINKLT